MGGFSSFRDVVRRSPLVFYVAMAYVWTCAAGIPVILNQKSTVIIDNKWYILGAATLGPVVSAFLTCYITNGYRGITLLARRFTKLPVDVGKHWYLYAFFLMPFLTGVAFALSLAFGGPTLDDMTVVDFLVKLALGLFVGSIGEEPGWRGILFPGKWCTIFLCSCCRSLTHPQNRISVYGYRTSLCLIMLAIRYATLLDSQWTRSARGAHISSFHWHYLGVMASA